MPGEQRFVVAVVVDMRDSTRLAATRLPFDAVFVIDRFVTAVGAAVSANGGRVSHFLGDGVMATFGLACSERDACRQALCSLVAMGYAVEKLNEILIAETGEAIRFGVGAHCGAAVVGEIGQGDARVFTTLGDVANVAARLEGLCKDLRCEAVISHDIWAMGGISADMLPIQETTLRGRHESLSVHPIQHLGQLASIVGVAMA
jgi:adenylate cyclase